tara:strand:- start:108 stop:305 length:198 start_codon:yes stop_codon:yes gene_type:complete
MTGEPDESSRPWHAKLNVLGSIGQVLSSEWAADDVREPIEDDDEEEEVEIKRRNTMFKRRRRIQY